MSAFSSREVTTDQWTEDEGQLGQRKQRQHLERIACAQHLADKFCADLDVDEFVHKVGGITGKHKFTREEMDEIR